MSDWADFIASYCVHAFWTGILLAVALAGILQVIPERESRIRYCLAYSALVLTAVLPLLFFRVEFLFLPETFTMVPDTPGWLPLVIASVWLVGACWKTLRFGTALFQSLDLRLNSPPVDDPNLLITFDEIRKHSGCSRKVRLLHHAAISGPLFSGWLFPAIIIPATWLQGVPPEHLKAILFHECAHARRWDYLANLIQEILGIALCFHPAAWWMAGVIRREREHCCDDFVVDKLAAPLAYSRALVWFESFRTASDCNRLCLALGGNDSIQPRIFRLLRVDPSQKKASATAIASGLLITALSLGSVATMLGAGSILIRSEKAEFPAGTNPSSRPIRNDDPTPPQGPTILRQTREVTATSPFTTRLILERNGRIFIPTEEEPVLHPPLPNIYVIENGLPLLASNLPNRDLDGDGFTVLEEFQAGTDPKNADSHPAFAQKLQFLSRKQQVYRIKFAARPDSERFQLIRYPTAKWPERDSFFARLGESTEDGILKIEKLAERMAQNGAGIRIDASELTVTFLPTGEEFQLVRNVEQSLPIYFAEFKTTLPAEKTFYVKKGESFVVPGDEDKWTLESISEEGCIIRNESTGARVTKTAHP